MALTFFSRVTSWATETAHRSHAERLVLSVAVLHRTTQAMLILRRFCDGVEFLFARNILGDTNLTIIGQAQSCCADAQASFQSSAKTSHCYGLLATTAEQNRIATEVVAKAFQSKLSFYRERGPPFALQQPHYFSDIWNSGRAIRSPQRSAPSLAARLQQAPECREVRTRSVAQELWLCLKLNISQLICLLIQ